ncbi:MAG: radical SAM protein [Elusimicrobia bacterium]|nr:radical SAM protein [Elusimicrobiota bacterium]
MKIFAWDIWLYCNYDCKFCNAKSKILPKKIYSIDEILSAWKYIYKKYGKCKICITGGEPLLYPNINLIIEELSKFHYVHITTNLSMDINFLSNKNIDRNNTFFNVTFHPCYIDENKIIEKLLNLKNYGYQISACYMNDSFQLLEFLNYKKIFNKYGFNISLVSNLNSNKNYKLLDNFIDNNSIKLYNSKLDNNNNNKICNAGIGYACVDENGDAYSCSIVKLKLGNIFNKNFDFINKNTECNKKCIIFENKY